MLDEVPTKAVVQFTDRPLFLVSFTPVQVGKTLFAQSDISNISLSSFLPRLNTGSML